MSIVGGAILPAVMGSISDLLVDPDGVRRAARLLRVCVYFAMRGHVSKLVGATP